MPPLHESLRGKLEKVVIEARDKAEGAAVAALRALAVDQVDPFGHMKVPDVELRAALRAKARQLGDPLKSGDPKAIEHLIADCAYEQWHRMLFARFLAENGLLMHPGSVAVSLAECDEMAVGEGATDGWDLAARYASRMLPAIFRPSDPVLKVRFAREHQVALENLLKSLSSDVFTADDSLGWVYQFWQQKRKDEVNESGVKIGADELPVVTQLFTEHYMVEFLLHNTLGAWWAGRHPGEEPPAPLRYLRRLEDGTPAAGTFPGWPKSARELTMLDPCCGSGHFLVAGFDLLVRFRMHEEGLSPRDACDAVFRDNLFGLEIDERCTQIAAFALALAAWRLPDAGGYRELPRLMVACSGIAATGTKDEWRALAGDDPGLYHTMEWLHGLFQNAPTLGSLINPREGALFGADLSKLEEILTQAVRGEGSSRSSEGAELGVRALGIAAAVRLLTREYTMVATNVPYLTRVRQGSILGVFCSKRYAASKGDLATAFVERCLEFTADGGTAAVVTPHNWLFLASYRRLRQRLLVEQTWNSVVRLGAGAFETIGGEVVNVALVTLTRSGPSAGHEPVGLDCSEESTPEEKAGALTSCLLRYTSQADLLRNAGSRIIVGGGSRLPSLSEFADTFKGICSGDTERFGRFFWEIAGVAASAAWDFQQSGVYETVAFGGREGVFLWEGGRGEFLKSVIARLGEKGTSKWIRGGRAWGRNGVVVRIMGDLPVTLYQGEIFDNNVAVVVPKKDEHLPALWAFCASQEFNREVRKLNQKMSVTDDSFIQVPFDLARWEKVAAEQYPGGLPEPYSEDPTQWLYKGTVVPSAASLHVAVARLLDYRWPGQVDDHLHALADPDGIVCLLSIRGEQPAAERLRGILAAAHGSAWSAAREQELLSAVGSAGKSLDDWLRDGFFEQHVKLFHNRPFIWHIWDGRKSDGFSALVNYHKLDRKLLETLAYSYLGDWIKRQEDGVRQGEGAAEARLLAARELQKKLGLILEGEPPYDIFVRWKAAEEQLVGWEPDLNDGVRLNIRPFMTADVLRRRPNIKWDKDRGKDPESAPWFHVFNGERINDHHLTNAEKRAAFAKAGVS